LHLTTQSPPHTLEAYTTTYQTILSIWGLKT